MTIKITDIDLLRHGETEGGACYRGVTDDSLSSVGWEKMQDKIANQTHWDLIISSPLLRCHSFSVALAEQLTIPIITSAAFQEINFGDWEGKKADQIDPILLAQFYADPTNFSVPNGEMFHDFQQRIIKAWLSLIRIHQGKQILLVTHAGVIRAILADILGIDVQHSFSLKIAHACFSSIQCFHDSETDDFFQLIKHG